MVGRRRGLSSRTTGRPKRAKSDRRLAKLIGRVASFGYFLVSVAFHRGYFEYLPAGARVWLEGRAGGEQDYRGVGRQQETTTQ
jgi:hypothetical protein